jgi:aspartate-semialdehyde dehydrogenase
VKIAVVGATGMVGEVLLSLLPKSIFAGDEIHAFASATSAGTLVPYDGKDLAVSELKHGSLKGFDLAFFAIGDNLSREYVPEAIEAGCRVVDKSNAFRMKEGVPLMVAGVNDKALGDSKLAANPNCTTIGFVHALAPLMQFGIEEVAVATYQSLSGAGRDAVNGFLGYAADVLSEKPGYYSPDLATAFQANPAVDRLEGDEYLEETKLRLETWKITGLDADRIFPTAVRVAVIIGHSMAVHVRLRDEVSETSVREAFTDNPTLNVLPLGEVPWSGWAVKLPDKVTVGRIRVRSEKRVVYFFATSDNLNIGAAFNGLRIAELMFS